MKGSYQGRRQHERPSGRGCPASGSRHRDIRCHTQTLATSGAMSQMASARCAASSHSYFVLNAGGSHGYRSSHCFECTGDSIHSTHARSPNTGVAAARQNNGTNAAAALAIAAKERRPSTPRAFADVPLPPYLRSPTVPELCRGIL